MIGINHLLNFIKQQFPKDIGEYGTITELELVHVAEEADLFIARGKTKINLVQSLIIH